MDNQNQNQDTEQPRTDEASTEPTPAADEPTAEGSTLRCDDPECVVGEDGYFNLPLAE